MLAVTFTVSSMFMWPVDGAWRSASDHRGSIGQNGIRCNQIVAQTYRNKSGNRSFWAAGGRRLVSIDLQLVLPCHGQSAWNKTNQLPAVDVLLTEQGVEEAKNGGRLPFKEKNGPSGCLHLRCCVAPINTANVV